MEQIIFVEARQLQPTFLLLCGVVIHLILGVLRGGRTGFLVTSLPYGGCTLLTLGGYWWWVTPRGVTFLLLSFLFWRLLLRLGRLLGLLGHDVLLKFYLKLRGSRSNCFGLLQLLLQLKKLLVDLAALNSLFGTSGSGGALVLADRKRGWNRVMRHAKCLLLLLILFLVLLLEKPLVQLLQLVNVVTLHHLLLYKMWRLWCAGWELLEPI